MPSYEVCRLGTPVGVPHDCVALIMDSDGPVITGSTPETLINEFSGSRPLGKIFICVRLWISD